YAYYATPYYPMPAPVPAYPYYPTAAAPAVYTAASAPAPAVASRDLLTVSAAKPEEAAEPTPAASGVPEAEAASLVWRGYERYFARDYATARDPFAASVAK